MFIISKTLIAGFAVDFRNEKIIYPQGDDGIRVGILHYKYC